MEIKFSEFIETLSKQTVDSMEPGSREMLNEAFDFGAKAHLGQVRANGQQYFFAHLARAFCL